MPVLELTSQNFQREVLEAKGAPVLVDFWAVWCGPCQILSPIVEEIAAHVGGKAKVAKLNVDDHRDVASRYNVLSIPTLIVFKDGAPVEQFIGVQTKDVLTAALAKHAG